VFIEHRNAQGDLDRGLAFASLVGELTHLAEADAFVGTPASSVVSRLAFLLIVESLGRIPPFVLMDAPMGCIVDSLTTDCTQDLSPWIKRVTRSTPEGEIKSLMGSSMLYETGQFGSAGAVGGGSRREYYIKAIEEKFEHAHAKPENSI